MCNCNKGASSFKSTPSQNSSSSLSFGKGKFKVKKTSYKVPEPKKIIKEEEPELEELHGETFSEKCLTFGYVLGLDHAVPERVLEAALENPDYAKRLLAQRDTPHLYDLVNNPPEKRVKISTSSLISKAGKALLQWGISGFPTVSKEVLTKREDACLACPNLVASTLVLQKISASSKITTEAGHRTGTKSCALCGCVIRNKIRLNTETCPQEVEATPGFNRWGEAVLLKD
jgi:hypothetical protein